MQVGLKSAISFYGIKKPYRTIGGTKIIPIACDPSKQQILAAKKAAENTKGAMEGYNGYAFFLGEDLVVKKYKGKDAFSNNPFREIDMLDKMRDNGILFQRSQRGLWAIEEKNGDTYLVSTRVEGENPDPKKENFNKENLESLMEIIYKMDEGVSLWDKVTNVETMYRFMNYDFNGGNIKITADKAGVFDFEYSALEDFNSLLFSKVMNKNVGVNCHQSDTSELPSSLRSFEFYTFCDYLCKLPEGKANKLFSEYLELKGRYHRKMFEHYSTLIYRRNILTEISYRELVHSRLLKKDKEGRIPDDILEAEARKIQMSNFIHKQSPFCDAGKINPEQLQEYTDESVEFFNSKLLQAAKDKDEDRLTYYMDCLRLFSSWKNVNSSLREGIRYKDYYVMKKLSEDYAQTLDRKVMAQEA